MADVCLTVLAVCGLVALEYALYCLFMATRIARRIRLRRAREQREREEFGRRCAARDRR